MNVGQLTNQVKTWFQLTHPARPVLRSSTAEGGRAVAASGLRLMTADSENMNDGIRSRSRTSQVARAWRIRSRFGVRSSRMAFKYPFRYRFVSKARTRFRFLIDCVAWLLARHREPECQAFF